MMWEYENLLSRGKNHKHVQNFPFIFKMFWKFSRLATAEVCMEEREELTDLPCIFAVFFFFFFNRVKYTFFKNLYIWGEGCS